MLAPAVTRSHPFLLGLTRPVTHAATHRGMTTLEGQHSVLDYLTHHELRSLYKPIQFV